MKNLEKNEKELVYTEKDAYDKWLNYLEKDGFSRYSHAGREPQITALAEILIELNINFEDAKTLKNKVIQVLMTEDGYKKRNKHSKGHWLRNTEMDFDRIIADYYIKDPERISQNIEDYVQDPEIVAWAIGRFGKDVSPKVLKDCHTIGNSLYFWFCEDLRKE